MEYTENDFKELVKPFERELKEIITPKFQYWYYSDCEISFIDVWKPIKKEVEKILNPFKDLEVYQNWLQNLKNIIYNLYEEETKRNKKEVLKQIQICLRECLTASE